MVRRHNDTYLDVGGCQHDIYMGVSLEFLSLIQQYEYSYLFVFLLEQYENNRNIKGIQITQQNPLSSLALAGYLKKESLFTRHTTQNRNCLAALFFILFFGYPIPLTFDP